MNYPVASGPVGGCFEEGEGDAGAVTAITVVASRVSEVEAAAPSLSSIAGSKGEFAMAAAGRGKTPTQLAGDISPSLTVSIGTLSREELGGCVLSAKSTLRKRGEERIGLSTRIGTCREKYVETGGLGEAK